MHIHIKYFASVREALGASAEHETEASTLAGLRDELLTLSPAHTAALARSRPVRMALDQIMCDEAAVLRDGCEVAFFPPVTGG